ncbi:homoserine O-succinyltransferase [Halobacillus sp. A5]|uniref:homoserine O-acetyltransferase MetA n=1 Tax=Halobacillus sp. A5 TaxID=2880263 RepID=UPI0020A63E24|nr:homoserine O-succinyltransferase [Halobacillus sp. A5]MCP3026551.1 homoserine O-succinyltransferase [Halobacillus sp. A5]
MPINIPKNLPAGEILANENIFIMDELRAVTQDIRPLNILILNLMPEKQRTETQLLRLLSNSPLQVNVEFLHTASYESKNVSKSHLEQFYKSFEQVKHQRYDGMIITGAPVEQLQFEQVYYWDELVNIMEWTKTHVTSVMHICWGAQAALYYHYGIDKYKLAQKRMGVFSHDLIHPDVQLVRGWDDEFQAPHSRFTDVAEEEVLANEDLILLSTSKEAGPFVIQSKDGKHVMVTGHVEYDAATLGDEYHRDRNKGLKPDLPFDYYKNNDPNEKPLNRWRSHAYIMFSNWLNYYVYQQTPYAWK